jgi:hypothetical protein
VAHSCEHGSKLLGSIKDGDFLTGSECCLLLKDEPFPWS